jgi:two-component system chemotaxis response regulator CheY
MAAILAVDDDPSTRDLLRLHLGRAGYTVTLAEDAIEAGRVLFEQKPDLIICDVAMPYLDGPQFIAAMRGDPEFARIPVIFLTCVEESEARCRTAGGLFLMKPILADRLLAAVSECLARPAERTAEGAGQL